MNEFHIKKGDIAMVNVGDNKGKTGRVLKVLARKQHVIIEGLNMVSRHTKPNVQNPQGATFSMGALIRISNLSVLDLQSGKGTRVGHRRDDNGRLVRFIKKSGEVIKQLWYRQQILRSYT